MAMQSGSYYIGDLCYVMHDAWEEVCDLIITDQTCLDGEFTLKDGRRFAIYSTMYGDGSYTTSQSGDLSVDSGSIGCILLSDIKQDDPSNRDDNGMIVHFNEDFETSGGRGKSGWDGVIRIGNLDIYTCDNEEEEYYDYDDDEEWEV